MSTTDVAAPTPDAPSAGREPRPRLRLLVLLLAVVGLVTFGYAAGLRSAWAAHHPTVVTGTVERVASVPPWGAFTPDGGGEAEHFDLRAIVWRDARTSDSGSIPSCLRSRDASFHAEVTVIELARPFGSGSYREVISLTCPGG